MKLNDGRLLAAHAAAGDASNDARPRGTVAPLGRARGGAAWASPFATGEQLVGRLEGHFADALYLRALSPGDAWPLWDASLNERFSAHLLWNPPATPQEARRRVGRFVARMAAEPVVYLSVAARPSGEWLGLLRIEHAPGRGVADALELGMWLHPRTWGSGISTVVGRLATDAIFLETGVGKVIAATATGNVPARKVLDAMGYAGIGPIPLDKEDGSTVGGLLTGITRAAWAAGPLTSLLPAEAKAA